LVNDFDSQFLDLRAEMAMVRIPSAAPVLFGLTATKLQLIGNEFQETFGYGCSLSKVRHLVGFSFLRVLDKFAGKGNPHP
jgi:hypothetical protein